MTEVYCLHIITQQKTANITVLNILTTLMVSLHQLTLNHDDSNSTQCINIIYNKSQPMSLSARKMLPYSK